MVKLIMVKNARILFCGEFQNISAGVIIEVETDFAAELLAAGIAAAIS